MPDRLTVHPACEAFPMLSDDELLDLAADITQNGLKYPIILDATGTQIVDGRNRQRACDMANVTPRYERLPEDADPLAYIYSANIARRHLTKGQQAIALAMLHPPGKGGRGKKNRPDSEQFSRTRLSEAREIVRHPDLAREVMVGGLPFDDALKAAQQRKEIAESAESHMHWLRNEAPELATLVDEERMTLPEAWAVLQQRKTEAEKAEKQRRKIMLDRLLDACRSVPFFAEPDVCRQLIALLGDDEFRGGLRQFEIDDEFIADFGAGAEMVGSILRKL